MQKANTRKLSDRTIVRNLREFMPTPPRGIVWEELATFGARRRKMPRRYYERSRRGTFWTTGKFNSAGRLSLLVSLKYYGRVRNFVPRHAQKRTGECFRSAE